MKRLLLPGLLALGSAWAADPALTIYNQNFAVVRDTVPLDLKAGVNDITFAGATALVEPESVVLRDASGKTALQILEQNYRNDAVSQPFLLSYFEGKTIDFEVSHYGQPPVVVPGKIIRSGYAIQNPAAMQRYGQAYQIRQQSGGELQPLIEVGGKLQFGLPGKPLFPSLPDDGILKPALQWKLNTAAPVKLDAEVGYLTGGMSWNADYNIVAPEKGDLLDLTGWVTMDNQSGKTFSNAQIKLMAGDVNRVEPEARGGGRKLAAMAMRESEVAAVTEKTFDEYHLYTLARKTTLRDSETKQVEFVRAIGVQAQRLYIYDGAQGIEGWRHGGQNSDPGYGANSQPKVSTMCEFKNSEANKLGIALPAGKLRFYRQGSDGQLEFTGENTIDHTPKDETIRVHTGNAFDLVGERKQTNFRVNTNGHEVDEHFEIKVRNHKQEPVEVRVVEHLFRWHNWEIREKSRDYIKTDSRTIEFRLPLKPDEEGTVTYHVHYSW